MSEENLSPVEALKKIYKSLDEAEAAIKGAKRWCESFDNGEVDLDGFKVNLKAPESSEIRATNPEDIAADNVVFGIFDGQKMVDEEGNTYPVPPNYASKSKLIKGDQLKLTITDTGGFIFKQIHLAPRKMVVGHMVLDGAQYQVLVDSKAYNVLYASVTFHRAHVGDKVAIIIPEEEEATWAAIENVIPNEGAVLQED